MKVWEKYLNEEKEYFIDARQTHNKKYTGKMTRKGKEFFLKITDAKGNEEIKKFMTQKQMKNYWEKIHKENLK